MTQIGWTPPKTGESRPDRRTGHQSRVASGHIGHGRTSADHAGPRRTVDRYDASWTGRVGRAAPDLGPGDGQGDRPRGALPGGCQACQAPAPAARRRHPAVDARSSLMRTARRRGKQIRPGRPAADGWTQTASSGLAYFIFLWQWHYGKCH